MSFTQLLYHIVFSPKNRQPIITADIQRDVYILLYRQILRHKGKVYRINGMPDHIHMLISLPANVSLSEVMKIIKQEVSKQISNSRLIHDWQGWQEGYGAFTVSYRDKDNVINYIIHQQDHHSHTPFIDEYRTTLNENGISEDDPYFP